MGSKKLNEFELGRLKGKETVAMRVQHILDLKADSRVRQDLRELIRQIRLEIKEAGL